ncbi:MAG TPA: ammonia-forming cytochrome c nitrite reductase subunit c552 [Tepidisphaeraceae bacterium]|nr:ammonia-forming cytochrome c nitrite reductase subunit c552 [Tepidisphaeraceae bacterium]
MTTTPTSPNPEPPAPQPRESNLTLLLIVIVFALGAGLIALLLVNIFQRKQEAKNPYIRFVNVTEETTDPAPWGVNWPRQYDQYKRTVEPSRTNFGGGDAPVPPQKADRYPWLTRMFAGYAFSLDYRDRRGHAYMLLDQEKTRRVTERPQPGACLHCHASVMPTYRRLGNGDAMKGFVELGKMPYQQAHDEVVKTGSVNPVIEGGQQQTKQVPGAHPVACVDCHDPQTMELRVTRPGFINGIKALKAGQGIKDYDPNRDATRQEMRSYVCGQCHVEYYCGPKTTLFFPWNNGLKVEQIESYYDSYKFPDGQRFFDWKHAETGAELLKAQHPEFELWNQGVHARSGVACADCHMPYMRQGALKVSDHWVRSPLLNIARACQVCHPYSEEELKSRANDIQNRNYDLLQRAGHAIIGLLDGVKAAKAAGATEPQLRPVLELHRKAQWRLDFIAAENSMGFHASQEAARILGESIDYARQGQIAAQNWRTATTQPATRPSTQP